MKKIILATLVLAVALGGCQNPSAALIPPDDLYPTALTQCAPEPTVPPRPAQGQPRTDSAKTQYTEDLHAAYEDCHDTVHGWKDRRDRYVKQYDAQNGGYLNRLWDALTDRQKSN